MSLLLVPLLAQALSVSAGDRTEVRLRVDGGVQQIDATTTGNFTLALASNRATWTLGYMPMISQFGVGSATSTLMVMHAANLQGRLQLTPRTSVMFSEAIAYGEMNFRVRDLMPVPQGTQRTDSTTPDTKQPQTDQTIARTGGSSQTTRFASASTTVNLLHQLDRRWQALARVGYFASQGLDDASRSRLPRVTSPSAGLTFAFQASPRDRWALRTDVSRSATFPDRVAWLATTALDLDRALTPQVSAGISIGAAYANLTKTVSNPPRTPAFPTANEPPYSAPDAAHEEISYFINPVLGANIQATYPISHTTLTFGARQDFAPYVDRITGTAVQRLAGTINSTWTARRVSVGFLGSTASTVGAAHEAQSLRYSFAFNQFVQYRIPRPWVLELGSRQSWFSYSNASDSPMLWSVYLAASYTTRSIPL